MVHLIGFTGLARVGKDTAADYLQRTYGYRKTAFADPLRHAAVHAFGVQLESFTSELKDVPDGYWGLSPRQMLQRLGTEGFRHIFGSNFWVRRWEMTYYRSGDRVSVSDVRFPNEAEAIRALGGVVVHMVRPDTPNVEGNHASVAHVPWVEGDQMLVNDSDLLSLYNKLDKIMELGRG